MKKWFRVILSAVLALVFCVGNVGAIFAQDKTPEGGISNWTILVYLNGDNDLNKMVDYYINQMEIAGPPSKTKVIVLVDNDEKPAKILDIMKDEDPEVINSSSLVELGEVNMGDGQTLLNFARFGAKTFPAKHYAMIIFGHGSGWEIGPDYSNSGSMLRVPAIKSALTELKEKDEICFDVLVLVACQMGIMDVAYELQDLTKFLVAAPDIMSSESPHFKFYLEILNENSDISAEDFARIIVNNTPMEHGYAPLVAVNCSYVPALVDSFSMMVRALKFYFQIYSYAPFTSNRAFCASSFQGNMPLFIFLEELRSWDFSEDRIIFKDKLYTHKSNGGDEGFEFRLTDLAQLVIRNESCKMMEIIDKAFIINQDERFKSFAVFCDREGQFSVRTLYEYLEWHSGFCRITGWGEFLTVRNTAFKMALLDKIEENPFLLSGIDRLSSATPFAKYVFSHWEELKTHFSE